MSAQPRVGRFSAQQPVACHQCYAPLKNGECVSMGCKKAGKR